MEEPPDSESEVIRRAEELAWRRVLQRAGRLRRTYRNLISGPESSWSLVNRAMLRFSEERRPTPENEQEFIRSMTSAMRSVLNDLYRRENAKSARPVRVPESLEVDPGKNLDQEEARAINALREELAKLALMDQEVDQKHAEIVALRYFEELPWKDIVMLTEFSEKKCRSTFHFAMSWLRAQLKQRGISFD